MKLKFVDSLLKAEKPKLTIRQKGRYIYHCYVCPKCHRELSLKDEKCKHCRQKINWEGD